MREVPSETSQRADGELEHPEGSIEVIDPWAAPGALIGGRYVVEGLLGSGGMGCVVRAQHRDLGELRAIKLLRPDRRLSADAERRLLREARAAARIQSAHVVRVMDVASDGPGAPYIVMEYLEGETLASRLRGGPIGPELAARIVIETCDALAEAHRAGTVHRDLKPSNLFLLALGNRRDYVKVLDFGIAKTEESSRNDWTHSQALLASPAYASPEQLRASKDADARADIWSLGVILYQCLTGALPFEGSTLAVLSSRILRDAPVPLRSRAAALPAGLEQIVDRCLEKSPGARFPHADALVEALAPFAPAAADECLARIRTLGPPRYATPPDKTAHSKATGENTVTHPSFERSARPTALNARPSRIWKRTLVAAAATALLAGAVFLAARSHRWSAPAPSISAARVETPVTPAAPVVPLLPEAARAATTKVATVPIESRRRLRRPGSRLAANANTPAASTGVTAADVVPIDRLPLDDLIDGRK